jgi:hypothetical protein
MNPDEIKTYATKIVIAGMMWLAARYLPADAGAAASAYIPTIAAGVVALITFGYAAYRSTNMKLVPENAVAVKPSIAVSPATAPAIGEHANVVGTVVG